MKKIIKFSLLLLRYFPSIAHYYFFYLLRYSKNPKKYPIEERYFRIRKLALKVCKGFKIELDVENKEYLLNRNSRTILVSDHISVLDIVMLIALSPTPVSFVAKSSVKHLILIGKVLTSIDGFFLDRNDPRDAIRIFRSATENMKNEPISYTIYPEGTRNKYPLTKPMLDFHPGSFKLAYKAEADILVFAEFGTQRILSNSMDRSNLIQMKFFPPIKYEDIKDKNTTEIASIAHEMVLKEVELMKEKYISYFASKKHKHKPVHGFKVD